MSPLDTPVIVQKDKEEPKKDSPINDTVFVQKINEDIKNENAGKNFRFKAKNEEEGQSSADPLDNSDDNIIDDKGM